MPAPRHTASAAARAIALRAEPTPSATEAAWRWLGQLAARSPADRDEAAAELAALFAAGEVPGRLDGPTDGILITTLVTPVVDRALAALARGWMPWLGKHFDAAAQRGDNRLTPGTRWLTRLVWPTYRTRPAPWGRAAFSFVTRVEPSALGDSIEVLAIDYGAVRSNPRLGIRRIRDELVRVAGDAHLGRILYRRSAGQRSAGRHRLIGYFALRPSPAGTWPATRR